MTGFFFIVSIGVIGGWIASLLKGKSSAESMNQTDASWESSFPETDENAPQAPAQTTALQENNPLKRLTEYTLYAMGCQPESNDDGNTEVRYQGETFVMVYGGDFIRIWDPNWHSVLQGDELNDCVMAMNRANFVFGPTIVVGCGEDGQRYHMSSRMDLVMPQTYNEEERCSYLAMILASFFNIKRRFNEELEKVVQERREALDPRVNIALFDLSLEQEENE